LLPPAFWGVYRAEEVAFNDSTDGSEASQRA
jgi:hypothetical protein